MAEPPDLEARLEAFSGRRKRPVRGAGVGALALLLGFGGAGIAYWLAISTEGGPDPLKTSDVTPFQDGPAEGGRLVFPVEDTGPAVDDAMIALEEALEVPLPAAPEPDRAVLDELARLREALTASQSQRNAEIQAAVRDLREAFDAQTRALGEEIEDRDRALAEMERSTAARIASLEGMLDAERAQREALEDELLSGTLIADQHLQEERRRQEEERRLRAAEEEAAELLAAQIRSPAVVFAGGWGGAAEVPSMAPTSAGPPYSLSADEAYLQNAGRPLAIEEAAEMAFPDRTLAQGTVIQATLQTAINSDLPGNVVAVVSEPVPAYSGDRILIPRGARLFGQYRSGLAVNQKRILVLWTRILTPDGTSLDIGATGGDPLGRAGLTGEADTKFDERFLGGALISIIGAGPAIAAAQTRDDIGSDVLSGIGTGLADATGKVIADQVSLGPTIHVDQGASVTVLVDRDIVVH